MFQLAQQTETPTETPKQTQSQSGIWCFNWPLHRHLMPCSLHRYAARGVPVGPVTTCPRHPLPCRWRGCCCPAPYYSPCPNPPPRTGVPVACRRHRWHRGQTPPTLQTMATAGSADSPDTADTTADGIRLAELTEQLPLARSSVFELVKALGITTTKGPGPGGRGRVAWVCGADAERISTAAQRVHRGEVRIADLAHGLQRPQSPQTLHSAGSAGSPDSPDAAAFLARLEAAERAISSGLGLTTNETAWVLGVRPGSSPLTRGGITATRTGWNCWRLSRC